MGVGARAGQLGERHDRDRTGFGEPGRSGKLRWLKLGDRTDVQDQHDIQALAGESSGKRRGRSEGVPGLFGPIREHGNVGARKLRIGDELAQVGA